MITTAWVNHALRIRGQDDLAVRAPCENLYSQLIPGITNVTDRARLYSFYPWLIWAFEKYGGPLKRKPLMHTLRRAECLLTLIGAWHTDQTGEFLWKHGGGLVGRNTLLPPLQKIKEGGYLRLSTYATTSEDTGKRYFKNRLGGLGQYYLSTLRDLGVLGGNAHEGVKYSPERGAPLAEAFDSTINRKEFFDLLESDQIEITDLKRLRRFCPCYLSSNEQEQSILTDLFFNREGNFAEASGNNRRNTLVLLLDLASRLETISNPAESTMLTVETFRACAYSKALPGGTQWVIPGSLGSVQDGWHLYHRNELLSIAVQGIFWAGLNRLSNEDFVLPNSEAYRSWFETTFVEAVEVAVGNKLQDALEGAARSIPPLEFWTDPNHEIQLGLQLSDIYNSFDLDDCHQGTINNSIKIILALLVREPENENPYAGYIDSSNYLISYPINLNSFCAYVKTTWKLFTIRELLGWLATRWGIEAHLKVALRKLRHENRDTFKIKPTERGLVVSNAPAPAFSHPRLAQAIQILWDLGALDADKDMGGFRITERGHLLKEECCG